MDLDQVHFILFNVDTHYWNVINDSNFKMFKFVRETLYMAVLDSACSWTVVGKLWFDFFFDMLNDQDKRLVKTVKSNRTFYFGDGIEAKANKSMKTAGMLDFKNDKCQILGTYIKLQRNIQE